MIELLRQQYTADMSQEEKRNRLREFLQIVCLKVMHDQKCFERMAFVGGTALRVLHDLRRFSEDLDFSVIEKKGYDFSEVISSLVRELALFGLDVEAKNKTEKTVQSSFLKFNTLLAALKLSPLKGEKLSIRIEVDSNPPEGWKTQTTLIHKTYIFPVVHFDLPSLYATKLHACFFRKFTKGKDFYDLLWYFGRKTQPNFLLLNNAIRQTEGEDLKLDETNFKRFLSDRLKRIDFDFVQRDVARFLEDKKELDMLNYESLIKYIGET